MCRASMILYIQFYIRPQIAAAKDKYFLPSSLIGLLELEENSLLKSLYAKQQYIGGI